MKKRTTTLIVILGGILVTAALVVWPGLHQIREKLSGKSSSSPENLTPNDWIAVQRTYPYGRINTEAYLAAVHQADALMKTSDSRTTPWIFTGPTNIGGRITDIESPPGNPSTIYIGASTGGVLKTTDFGQTWVNLFGNIPVISVGDIAIDPNDTSIIFCGTGEANSSSFSFLGNGIYKSTNGGTTWNNIGLENSVYIGRIVVDYANSQRIFVAACGNLFTANDERGVYRSENGGQTWQRVLFLNDSTSAIDLVQHPQNPQIIFAAMWERIRGLEYRRSFGNASGIWKSTDGGTTWSEVTNGLPFASETGRIGLTICQSAPNNMYAFYDLPNYEIAVYKSTDAGENWTRTNDGSLFGNNSNFGWYFGQIRVSPENPNEVYVMGVSLYKSSNGGQSWNDISNSDIHVDHHAMIFDMVNNRLVEGNDGGLYFSTNGGNSWNKINNLPLTQFYAIEIDYQEPYRIYGGTQDNNTIRTLTGNINDWEPILGGDGMYTLVDYTNSDIIYAEYQYGNLHRSDNGGYWMNYIAGPMSGDRVNWSAPLVMHPEDPEILYFGTYRVWKSIDRGDNWTPVSDDLTKGVDQYFHTLTTLAISQVNPSIVVAGSGDGKLHVSTDNGFTWTDRTAGLPDRWITRVASDPFDQNILYVTISGFRWDEPLPHIYRSADLGQTWTSITGNLPEFPVNDIAIDPDIPGHYVAATDAGIYATSNGGESWYWAWQELPAVPVYTMKVHVPSRTLVAGTYGLSSYRADLDELITSAGNILPETRLKIKVSPNPVSGSASITFTRAENRPARLRIFLTSIGGKLTQTIAEGDFPAGMNKVAWNPRVDPEAAPGVYLLHISGAGCSGTCKVVIL